MPIPALIPAVATVGAAIIGGNAAKKAGADASQQQQNLQQSATQQQQQYIAQQEQALRNAVMGLASNGNPYLNARSSMPAPSFMGGGTFGGQQFGGGSATPQSPGAPAPSQLPANLMQQLAPFLQSLFGGGNFGAQGGGSSRSTQPIAQRPETPAFQPPMQQKPYLPPRRLPIEFGPGGLGRAMGMY